MSPRGTQVPDGAIMTVMTQSFQGMLEPASAASFSSQRLRAASSASRLVDGSLGGWPTGGQARLPSWQSAQPWGMVFFKSVGRFM